MYQRYMFEKEGKLLLFMEIASSFAPNCYFKVYKDYEKTVAYWRTELKRDDYFDLLSNLHTIKVSSLQEISKTSEYHRELDKVCPVNSQVLTKEQESIISKLLNAKLDEKIELSGGRDGHSYRIMLHGDKMSSIRCWCIISPEWKLLADIINTLVIDVAGLDPLHYAIKMRNC